MQVKCAISKRKHRSEVTFSSKQSNVFRMDKIAELETPLDTKVIVDDAILGSAILSIRPKTAQNAIIFIRIVPQPTRGDQTIKKCLISDTFNQKITKNTRF